MPFPLNYDKHPVVAVPGHENETWQGWKAIIGELQRAIAGRGPGRCVLAIETYSGVLDEELLPALEQGLNPSRTIQTLHHTFKSPNQIDDLVAPELGGEDPIFGRMTRLTMEDFLDPNERAQSLADCRNAQGLVLVYGPGALLCCEPDLIVYADMARWEAQMRQRRNQISNLGVENRSLAASLQYKRSFFIDWRVCDKLKRASYPRWDYLLDTCVANEPRLVTAAALRTGLATAAARPFRVVPFFDPGPWGGQWMRQACGLPDGPPNYAWCFDCVPEENSLLLGFGSTRVEIPSINLVFFHPDELLGEPVHGRFGAEFPIRFDFLDTMGGGNLSFQVHPDVDYAREHFGLSYTQDESYYLLDAEPGACVYLGLKEGVEPHRMMDDLRQAQSGAAPFPDEEHVARWPARKHDHFLIPAGTCHCSGAGSMVLEISHTPYIFTFKMWDWGRLGLDGNPRPINIDRGEKVIRWERTKEWVGKHLVNHFEEVASGPGWREERTGLYRAEFLETRRHWFSGPVPHDTMGESVHVLNLVEGAEAVVESPTGAFEPFVVHYAETFIVPAAVGAYTVRPSGAAEGSQCATMKAYVRVRG